jgi:hypothetical protein
MNGSISGLNCCGTSANDAINDGAIGISNSLPSSFAVGRPTSLEIRCANQLTAVESLSNGCRQQRPVTSRSWLLLLLRAAAKHGRNDRAQRGRRQVLDNGQRISQHVKKYKHL